MVVVISSKDSKALVSWVEETANCQVDYTWKYLTEENLEKLRPGDTVIGVLTGQQAALVCSRECNYLEVVAKINPYDSDVSRFDSFDFQTYGTELVEVHATIINDVPTLQRTTKTETVAE